MGTLPTGVGSYRWWYLDALSHDGRDGLVVIFFSGSVFSPYYAARLRAGEAVGPGEHAAVHVALYRGGARVGWLLAEHDRTIALTDAGRVLTIGRSSWRCTPEGWTIEIDDAHGPFRMNGRVEIAATEVPLEDAPIALCPGVAAHYWHPRALRARVRASFARPGFELETEGGYHDSNFGDEPLERALAGWDWARVHAARDRDVSVLYDVRARDGRRFRHAVASGAPPRRLDDVRGPPVPRARTRWAIDVPRALAGELRDAPWTAQRARVWEDTPFYARYSLAGDTVAGVGETLDLRRFDSAAVRWMLRWRTWREGQWPLSLIPRRALTT